VRSIVGTLGLVAAVPITTALAALTAGRGAATKQTAEPGPSGALFFKPGQTQ
jgi:hypothetical protein